MGELEPADHILLTAFRGWIAGRARSDPALWECAWNDFARHLGPERGRAAISALAAVVDVLRREARRPIQYHQPCCACIGEDETCLLRLIAAACKGDQLTARRTCRTMVSEDGVGELMANVTELARAFPGAGQIMLAWSSQSAALRRSSTITTSATREGPPTNGLMP